MTAHRTNHFLPRVSLNAAIVLVAGMATLGAGSRGAGHALVNQVVHFAPEDGMSRFGANMDLRRSAHALVNASPTFADLLRRLDRPGELVIVARSSRLEPRIAGRTRFSVDGSLLKGDVEIQDFSAGDFWLRAQTLSHELAHAYEVVCLAAGRSSVREVLLARSIGRDANGAMDTPFPRAVEQAVAHETRHRTRGSQLDALARTFGVCTDSVDAAARGTR
jgi:hypothetical protein